MAIVLSAIYIAFTFLYPANDPKMQFGIYTYMVPYLLLIPIRFTVPKIVDNFYVRREMKYIFICLTTNYVVFYAIRLVIYYGDDIDVEMQKLLRLITYLTLVFCQFAAMMVSTFWVNRQCDRIITANQYDIHDIRRQECVRIQPSRYDAVKQASDGHIDEISLEMVLNDDCLFDSFATHVTLEFCAECLLSLIEFEQFKARAIDELHVETSERPITFASSVPRSEITHGIQSWGTNSSLRCFAVDTSEENDNGKRNLKACAYQLYNKYVSSGSEFEINISGQMRAKYEALLADYSKWMDTNISPKHLCGLFEEASSEMTSLLRSSCQRFVLQLEKRDQINRDI